MTTEQAVLLSGHKLQTLRIFLPPGDTGNMPVMAK